MTDLKMNTQETSKKTSADEHKGIDSGFETRRQYSSASKYFLLESYAIEKRTEFIEKLHSLKDDEITDALIDDALNKLFLFRIKRDYEIFYTTLSIIFRWSHFKLSSNNDSEHIIDINYRDPAPKSPYYRPQAFCNYFSKVNKEEFEEKIRSKICRLVENTKEYEYKCKCPKLGWNSSEQSVFKTGYLNYRLHDAEEKSESDKRISAINTLLDEHKTYRYNASPLHYNSASNYGIERISAKYERCLEYIAQNVCTLEIYRYNSGLDPAFRTFINPLPFYKEIALEIFGIDPSDPSQESEARNLWKFSEDIMIIGCIEWFMSLERSEKLKWLNYIEVADYNGDKMMDVFYGAEYTKCIIPEQIEIAVEDIKGKDIKGKNINHLRYAYQILYDYYKDTHKKAPQNYAVLLGQLYRDGGAIDALTGYNELVINGSKILDRKAWEWYNKAKSDAKTANEPVSYDVRVSIAEIKCRLTDLSDYSRLFDNKQEYNTELADIYEEACSHSGDECIDALFSIAQSHRRMRMYSREYDDLTKLLELLQEFKNNCSSELSRDELAEYANNRIKDFKKQYYDNFEGIEMPDNIDKAGEHCEKLEKLELEQLGLYFRLSALHSVRFDPLRWDYENPLRWDYDIRCDYEILKCSNNRLNNDKDDYQIICQSELLDYIRIFWLEHYMDINWDGYSRRYVDVSDRDESEEDKDLYRKVLRKLFSSMFITLRDGRIDSEADSILDEFGETLKVWGEKHSRSPSCITPSIEPITRIFMTMISAIAFWKDERLKYAYLERVMAVYRSKICLPEEDDPYVKSPYVKSYYNLIKIAADHHLFSIAEKLFEDSLQHYEYDYRDIIIIKRMLDKADEAKKLCEEAIAKYPESIKLLMLMADICRDEGNFEDEKIYRDRADKLKDA